MVPPLMGPALGVTVSTAPCKVSYLYCAVPGPASWPLLLADTMTEPASRIGAVHATMLELMYSPPAKLSPNLQLSSSLSTKCCPTRVTTCPDFPLIPREGRMLSTLAPASYRYILPSLVKSAPLLMLASTVSFPCPSLAGAVSSTFVDDAHITSLLSTMLVPTRSNSPSSLKPVPTTVTSVSPAVGPRVGCNRTTAGCARYTYCTTLDACTPPESHTRLTPTISAAPC